MPKKHKNKFKSGGMECLEFHRKVTCAVCGFGNDFFCRECVRSGNFKSGNSSEGRIYADLLKNSLNQYHELVKETSKLNNFHLSREKSNKKAQLSYITQRMNNVRKVLEIKRNNLQNGNHQNFL
ncbi:hypothetical protein Ciccas_000073 [Cichlidogyrus casuarinus]|uniref:B box-type domain-containing protein n=1 Tax=Cichlidogyrus casuarinus TaxID=1844966 RepID=A0ABD2QNZ1_9PLAT